jgi:site-specific DNA-cytosine methylase
MKSLDYDPAAIAVHAANLGDHSEANRRARRAFPPPPSPEKHPSVPRRGYLLRKYHDHLIVDLGSVIENAPDLAALRPDLIFGGPPCQPYSKAGAQIGDYDPRSELTEAFAIMVVCASPKYFVMENVKDVSTSQAYQRAADMLRLRGYGLTEVVVDASFYGNAQRRKRWICAGCLGESEGWFHEYLEQYKSPRQKTVADVLGPDFGVLKDDCLVDPAVEATDGKHYKLRDTDRAALRRCPPDVPIYFWRPGGPKSSAICRVDRPCPTITGKSTQGVGKNYRPHADDPIDLRKLAHPTFEQFSLLAGFPADWNWEVPVSLRRNDDGTLSKAEKVTETQIRQMVGNSVAPSLAECIGLAILDHDCGLAAGRPSSKSQDANANPVVLQQPGPFVVPKGYKEWLRDERGLLQKAFSQEISNLKRVKRYVAGRRLATASEELQALKLAPPPAFRALKSANRSTLRSTLQAFAEWEAMTIAAERERVMAARWQREHELLMEDVARLEAEQPAPPPDFMRRREQDRPPQP